MKLLKSLLLVTCLLSTQVYAQEAKPTEASVEELMNVANVRDMLKGMDAQMDTMMKTTMQQVTQGKQPTPEQQAALDNFNVKLKEIMHEELNWDSLKPQFVQIYRDTLSQEEVDGIIVFYKTPVGQAMIKKMPQIMQASMGMVQKRMPEMMQKIQQAAKESFKDLKPAK